ncbi:MAG: TRAM domain-containing protein [Candidatus Micrarchaeaceae archaeon]
MSATDNLEEGSEYEVQVLSKSARGEGIGRISNMVVFIKDAKTRVGNKYKIKITKVHRTFAYAELHGSEHEFIGSSMIEL